MTARNSKTGQNYSCLNTVMDDYATLRQEDSEHFKLVYSYVSLKDIIKSTNSRVF